MIVRLGNMLRNFVFGFVLAAGAAHATTENAHKVMQPLHVDDTGVVPGVVTYLSEDEFPGVEVLLTVAENRVSTPNGFENRNIASKMRVALRFVEHTDKPRIENFQWPGLFGDTLRVVMDLTKVKERGKEARAALEVTKQCLIENAHHEQRVGHLDLLVEGPALFADLAGFYSLF